MTARFTSDVPAALTAVAQLGKAKCPNSSGYYSFMKKVSITDYEAKNQLSALIDSLKGGSPVLIVDRGRPARTGDEQVGR